MVLAHPRFGRLLLAAFSCVAVVVRAESPPTPKTHRDPVAAARRSEAALNKVATHTLEDGSPAHSFRTLLQELSTIVRNTCQPSAGPTQLTFQMTTVPNPTQQRALQLLNEITV